MAILPLAPGRFSITTGWPSNRAIPSAKSRAAKSVPPPGGLGTSTVIGRLGAHPCARAGVASSSGRARRFIK
jgi:hypothetical protein